MGVMCPVVGILLPDLCNEAIWRFGPGSDIARPAPVHYGDTDSACSASRDVNVEQRGHDEAGGNDSQNDEGQCDAIGSRR